MNVRGKITMLLLFAGLLIGGGACMLDSPGIERIAVGGDLHQSFPQPIWDSILEERPDLFIFLGDNVQGDTRDMDVLRLKYALMDSHSGFQALRASTPVMATWDDHDFGANDAGSDYPRKQASQRIFLEFWGEPHHSPRWRSPGVYTSRIFGPGDHRVQVILLDTRYFRSPLVPNTGPDRKKRHYLEVRDDTRTILGEAQWNWLAYQLLRPARVRLIVSSIQVLPVDHGYEKWHNLIQERERLIRMAALAGGVIFVSADRHFAEISMMAEGTPYPLFELTSSGMNLQHVDPGVVEFNRYRMRPSYPHSNFGLIKFYWFEPEPAVELLVKTEKGEIAASKKFKISRLR